MTRSLTLAAALAVLLVTGAQAHQQEQITCNNYGCSDRVVANAPSRAAKAAHASKHSRRSHVANKRHERDTAPARIVRVGMETVSTAAGITITVASDFAEPIKGFISDLVARGYHPHQIHCYATGGHVRHSLHYSGHACDFDQRGWGKTAAPMYHVASLCAKWGLRDGGEFRDWGHIDNGRHLRRGSHAEYQASHPPFYGVTADFNQSRHVALHL